MLRVSNAYAEFFVMTREWRWGEGSYEMKFFVMTREWRWGEEGYEMKLNRLESDDETRGVKPDSWMKVELSWVYSILLDDKGDVIAAMGTLGEAERHALLHQYLAWEGEADACARRLCREEGDEDFLLDVEGDDVAVVGEKDPPPPFRGSHSSHNSP